MSAEAYADDDVAARVAELYSKGNKLYDKEKWAEAEAAYQAAWDLRPSFDIAGNLGDVEMQLGQYRDAAEHLTYAIQEFPAGGKAEARETLTKLLEAARTQVGSVKIVTNIGGAKLSVDGHAVGQAPLEKAIFVDPGKRVFEARLAGFEDGLVTANVEKGKSQEVSFKLIAKGGGGGGGNGGGKGLNVPLFSVELSAAVACALAGGAFLYVEDLRIQEAKTIVADGQLVAGDCPGKNAADVTACQNLRANLRDQDMYHNLVPFAFAISGAWAIAAVVTAVSPKKAPAKAGITFIAPTAAPGYGGLSFAGHF